MASFSTLKLNIFLSLKKSVVTLNFFLGFNTLTFCSTALRRLKIPKFIVSVSNSTRGVIGQFCAGPYFTVRPAKFESRSFPARSINLSDIINILQTSFSRSVLQVMNPRFENEDPSL